MSAPSPLPSRVLCGALLLLASAAAGQGADGFDPEASFSARERSLEQRRTQKSQAEQRLANLEPRDRDETIRLARDARALYRMSRGGMLPLAGGIGAVLGHAARISRLEQLVQRDLASVRAVRSETQSLRGQVDQLAREIQSGERELESLSAARIGAARQRALQHGLEAALQSLPPPQSLPTRAQYGLSLVGGGLPSERFVEQRGNLALPISGPTRIEDASRAESDGPGLEFSGNSGDAVRAAASGRVAFAESYGSYGKLVILEHGERHYSVYGGLARFEVQVGDTVSKSARLGSLGGDPLYFEVRRGTKSQDARTWLGL